MVAVRCLRTACINKDYCGPIHCLGAKQRTPSPSLVAFYDMHGKDWAVCICFVPVHTRGLNMRTSPDNTCKVSNEDIGGLGLHVFTDVVTKFRFSGILLLTEFLRLAYIISI